MAESDVRQRAFEVAKMPHVQEWVQKFQELALTMPPEVWVLGGGAQSLVLATDPVGQLHLKANGEPDGEATVAIVFGGNWG